MIVAVLVATSVYDHGVIGVYTGEDAEQRAAGDAASIWSETDGHHAFRIDVMKTNFAYPDVFPYQYLVKKHPVISAPIEIVRRASAS